MEESWRRKWKVVRKWNVIVWKGILPAYRSTMLTACVFVSRDTVRHPRRFVFGKLVRKPNYSWSEAFVNRGLNCIYIYIYILSHFNQTCNLSSFSQNIQIPNFMEIRPVGAALFHGNGKTDGHDEANTHFFFRTIAKPLKMLSSTYISRLVSH